MDGERSALHEIAARNRGNTRGKTRLGLWVIPFVLALPFLPLLFAGEVLAWPLQKHRHRNLAFWLLFNLLRNSVVIAVSAWAIYWLISRLHH